MDCYNYDLGIIYEFDEEKASLNKICFIDPKNGKILGSDKFTTDYSVIKNNKLYIGSNRREAIKIIKNPGNNQSLSYFSNELCSLLIVPRLKYLDLGVYEIETIDISEVKKNPFYEKLLLGEIKFLISDLNNSLDKTNKNTQEAKVNVVKSSNSFSKKNYNALDIINYIKSVVIGQDNAIETIVTNILLNQKLNEINDPYLLKSSKRTILIDGPTSVGKTLITEEVSKLINIPMTVTSSTNYSGVGYVDSSLSTTLIDLLNKTNGNLQKAMRGVIFFDEVDKLGDSSLEMRKAIQQELLTWLNGTKIKLKYDGKDMVFDTSYITFVFAGAFTNMRKIKNSNRTIGFGNTVECDYRETFDTEDYIKFGMETEFMARITSLITLQYLSKEDLKNILITSKVSPLLGLSKIFISYNSTINYTEDFIDRVVDLAYADKCGARSLQKIVNKLADKLMLPLMSGQIDNITLTSDMLDKNYIFQIENTKKLTL